MNFCECGKQISEHAEGCPSCAMKAAYKRRRKKVGLSERIRKYKLRDAKTHLKEAERLYALVTGRQMSRYWYSKITQLKIEITALERGGKQHARPE